MQLCALVCVCVYKPACSCARLFESFMQIAFDLDSWAPEINGKNLCIIANVNFSKDLQCKSGCQWVLNVISFSLFSLFLSFRWVHLTIWWLNLILSTTVYKHINLHTYVCLCVVCYGMWKFKCESEETKTTAVSIQYLISTLFSVKRINELQICLYRTLLSSLNK